VTDQQSAPRHMAPTLEHYPHRVAEIIRYRDLDPQGHVNQATFSTYFESGRVAMFRGPDLGIGVADATFVLARIEIDYLKELHWPGNIEVGTAVAVFGRSSFTVAQAIFQGEVCAATARATMVMIDRQTRRASPLTDDIKARLGRWIYRGG
jgi:acyl-CoA thioester hydrolase